MWQSFIGIAENLIATLISEKGGDVIGFSILAIICIVASLRWHRRERAAGKPGMGSIWFIILCFAIAGIGVGGAVYGLVLRSQAAVSSLQSELSETKQKLATAQAVPRQAPAAAALPSAPPRVVTAAYDVPKKLAAIDGFIEILKTDIAATLIEVRRLEQTWGPRVQTTEQRVAFMEEVRGFRVRTEEVRLKINRLQQDNRAFDDIYTLLDQDYVGSFFGGLDAFNGAVGSMGDPPYKMDTSFFMKPYMERFHAGIESLSNWFDRKNAQALEVRRRFSQ